MRQAVADQLNRVTAHLYINPLERCNLRCKICYTRKTSPILTNDQILTFIKRYQVVKPISSVTFCGGEVFTLPKFPTLVNTLTDQGILVPMITNGTIDRLSEFTDPNLVNLIVSIDGQQNYHDANRGEGMFTKSTAFLKKAKTLGFHTEIFSIVTRQNHEHIDAFEATMATLLGGPIPITYHPRKPPMYLTHHPISNIVGTTDGFDYLTDEQMLEIMRNRTVFPPKDLGCYQIAVASDGRVYGCCEGTVPLGHMDDPIEGLITALTRRLEAWELASNLGPACLGCSQPDFVCGIKGYLLKLHNLTPE